jgi:hypothetical protein
VLHNSRRSIIFAEKEIQYELSGNTYISKGIIKGRATSTGGEFNAVSFHREQGGSVAKSL